MTKAKQKAQSVEHNRQLLAHAWKVGQDYGVDIFSHDFRAWESVAEFLNQNHPGEKTWTADSVRLLSYWYRADNGVVTRRPRKVRGTGTVAVNRLKNSIACRLKANDPVFENIATAVLTHYKNTRSPKAVAQLLNRENTVLMTAYRKQRGEWSEDTVDKAVRRCKKQRPDLFTRVMGEPPVTRKRKQASRRQQAFALGDAATDAAAFVADFVDTPALQVRPVPPTQYRLKQAKTTRVSIQLGGEVLQVIRTPQQRLIVSAKSTDASGGKFVAAVAKLCQELGVDVSKW